MRHLVRSGFALLLLAFAAGLTVPVTRAETGDAALRPGASGVAITVLRGSETREIPLRYLGTYEDFAGPGYDLHLVELEGAEAEDVGVAAGMSGSPVYIDGRLIGALSYRLGLLPKHPVAGVTPIEQVLDAARGAGAAPAAAASGLTPIATPLVVSGLAPGVREWFEGHLEDEGFVVVAGGGGARSSVGPTELRPGSPVGVELVRGDLGMAATGTVTWVDGDKVYAFGHPFLGIGRAELPMTNAVVIHTLADLAGSVKLARVGAEVGAIVEDRKTAIVGELGRRARMTPFELTVRGGDYGAQQFRFEVARNTPLAPLLMGTVVANALRQNTGFMAESTLLVRGTVRMRDLPDLPLEMSFAGDGAGTTTFAVANAVFQTLAGLHTNPYEVVEIESVEMTVDVREGVTRYRIEDVRYDRGTLRPGENLELTCVLRAYRGETLIERLSVALPERLPENLVLAVGSPERIDRVSGGPIDERYRSATDTAAMVRALVDRKGSHRLTAVVYESGRALVSRGAAYTDLPPTVERLLATQEAARSKRRTPLVTPVGRAELALDGPVEGVAQVRLRIERP